jgi:hypothetical protein
MSLTSHGLLSFSSLGQHPESGILTGCKGN